jgi:HD-GYP domain-containing protein (c-di-GMP phosphodiesterase class II)
VIGRDRPHNSERPTGSGNPSRSAVGAAGPPTGGASRAHAPAPPGDSPVGRDRWLAGGPAERLGHYQPLVVDRLAFLAAQTVGTQMSAILACTEATSDRVTAVAVWGADLDLVGSRFAADSGLAGLVLSSAKPTAVYDARQLGDALRRAAPRGTRTAAAAPIHFAGRLGGVVLAASTNAGGACGVREFGLLGEFGELCGLALGHHRRHEQLAATAEGQLHALETALALWDGYTAEHSEAVVRLAVGVGRRLGMSALELVELDLAARLHDVGKLRVPGEILRKPGRLTDAEWQLIRQHPAWGAELVARIPGLEAVAALVRFHHERPDGSGYPHGLAGERIPLAARVVAVCDAYRAMTEQRPYRSALGPARAFAELRSAAGRQFDPRIVEALEQELAARPQSPPDGRREPARRSPATTPQDEPLAPPSLSHRQLQVLALLARGASGEQAAAELGLSPQTVRTYVRDAMSRLGADTRAHAVALAITSGQISLHADPPAPPEPAPDPVRRLLS